jgi:hypothetical protein
MCLSCGCGDAHDPHDSKDYITYEDLAKAAAADGITVNDVIKNINAGVVSDRKKHESEYDEVVK